MKTINITLYSFDELSEDVQKQIIDRERWNIMEQCMDGYGSDYQQSLEKFEELMDITVSNWRVDYCDYNYRVQLLEGYVSEWSRKDKYGNEETCVLQLEDLEGKLLYRYLQRIIKPSLYTNKTYWKSKYIDGKFIGKERHSRIIEECECPLTGCCYDMYLIDPILEYIKKPDYTLTYKMLMDKCVDSFFEEWHKEYRYWADNEDAIREELHNNQYEDRLYYADGRVYDGPLDVVA